MANFEVNKMKELGLSNFLARTCENLGLSNPTPIQKLAIPAILEKKNVFGMAKTGTGKTAAFALPVIEALAEDPFGVFCLVLTPTRELAAQLASQFRLFGESCGLTEQVICGGQSLIDERQKLATRPHVVVATPGRLAAHFQSADLPAHFKFLRFLVLDEVDRLFEPCFYPDLTKIFNSIPGKCSRQTLLFSATKNAALNFLLEKEAETIKTLIASEDSVKIVGALEGFYLFVPRAVKECYLASLLSASFPKKQTLVFVSRRQVCCLLAETLIQLDIVADALHAQLKQAHRVAALEKFRSGKTRVLVCTDLAARGLDVPSVDLVINFNVPLVSEDYVHRVGRAARGGKEGKAITMVSQYEVDAAKNIEKETGRKLHIFEAIEKEEILMKRLRKVSCAKKIAKLKLAEYKLKNEK